MCLREGFQTHPGYWLNSILCSCRSEDFISLLAVSQRLPSVPRGHLQFSFYPKTASMAFCFPKTIKGGNPENRLDIFIQHNYIHIITYIPSPLMCAIGQKQVIRPTMLKGRETHKGMNNRGQRIWGPPQLRICLPQPVSIVYGLL